MRSQEEKIRQMLDKFSRELLRAIHGSPSMTDAVQQIRSEGFALHLALGCEQAPFEASRAPVANDAKPPKFRLNTEDVTFLKSIGIDPTRNARRRRKSV